MGIFQQKGEDGEYVGMNGGRGEAPSSSLDIASHDPEKVMEQQEESAWHGKSSQPQQFDAALEKRIVRKIDMHLIPLVMVLCAYCPPVPYTEYPLTVLPTDLLAYLDRSNIG